MSVTRRSLLRLSATAAVAASAGVGATTWPLGGETLEDWAQVRSLFSLDPDTIHMSAMLITSHPAPVAEAIERHRRGLDADPVEYLEENGSRLTDAVREAAGQRLGVRPSRVALTDSTTEGVALVYTSLALEEDDEALVCAGDYYVTQESLRLMAKRTGATIREVEIGEPREATAEGLAEAILGAVGPKTRLVALTWVNSGTGLKMPVRAIADGLAEINAERDAADAVLLGLDAVHGFAVDASDLSSLGVDFMMAGCHKWLFGPRGTGVVAFSERGLEATRPTVPSFDDSEVYSAWYVGREPRFGNSGVRMSPGGFKAFEHRWAMTEAFELHEWMGRERVAERTYDLATALKKGLGDIGGIEILTPDAPELSAGIVAFTVDGVSAQDAVRRLRERRIIASVAPYPRSAIRLTPSVRNSEDEIEDVLRAVRGIA